MVDVELPFPPAILSGHAKGNGQWAKIAQTKKHRQWALDAAKAAGWAAPEGKGDIHLLVAFYPADRRGDRWNFVARAKAQVDGLADAMGVNDRRFLPRFIFAEPCKNARVVYSLLEE